MTTDQPDAGTREVVLLQDDDGALYALSTQLLAACRIDDDRRGEVLAAAGLDDDVGGFGLSSGGSGGGLSVLGTKQFPDSVFFPETTFFPDSTFSTGSGADETSFPGLEW